MASGLRDYLHRCFKCNNEIPLENFIQIIALKMRSYVAANGCCLSFVFGFVSVFVKAATVLIFINTLSVIGRRVTYMNVEIM